MAYNALWTVDAVDLEEDAYDEMRNRVPGWEPSDADIETQLIATGAQMGADSSVALNEEGDAFFQSFGQTVVNIQPNGAVPARGTVTITVAADAGTVAIGANFQIVGLDPTGTERAFRVVSDVQIISPSTSLSGIVVQALETGPEYNDVSGDAVLNAGDLDSRITAISFDEPTDGGSDEEDTEDYLERLTERLQLPTNPVLAEHFAAYGRFFLNNNARVVAIDNLDPGTELLTDAQQDIDASHTGWVADANVTLSSDEDNAFDDGYALKLTATSTAAVTANTSTGTSGRPVSEDVSYTASARVKAAVTGRTAALRIFWYDASGAQLSFDTGDSITDSTTYETISVTADAPADAAFAAVGIYLATPATSEVHYLDRISLRNTAQTDQPMFVTLSGVWLDGSSINDATSDELMEYMNSIREINFQPRWVDPEVTELAVAFTAIAEKNMDIDAVHDAIVAAIESYLSPATWGATTQAVIWENTPTVYYLDVVAAAKAVRGVRHLTSLTINGDTEDIELPGFAPLADARGQVTGTVTA